MLLILIDHFHTQEIILKLYVFIWIIPLSTSNVSCKTNGKDINIQLHFLMIRTYLNLAKETIQMYKWSNSNTVYLIQHLVINFVSYWQMILGLCLLVLFPPCCSMLSNVFVSLVPCYPLWYPPKIHVRFELFRRAFTFNYFVCVFIFYTGVQHDFHVICCFIV